jgi:hypothetical protein
MKKTRKNFGRDSITKTKILKNKNKTVQKKRSIDYMEKFPI